MAGIFIGHECRMNALLLFPSRPGWGTVEPRSLKKHPSHKKFMQIQPAASASLFWVVIPNREGRRRGGPTERV
jgi:hypothetical protein